MPRCVSLRRSCSVEGVFREIKLHRRYKKPSERRAHEKADAVVVTARQCASAWNGWAIKGKLVQPAPRRFSMAMSSRRELLGCCGVRPRVLAAPERCLSSRRLVCYRAGSVSGGTPGAETAVRKGLNSCRGAAAEGPRALSAR